MFTVKLFLLNEGGNYILNVAKEFSLLVVSPDFIKAQFQLNNPYVQDWTMLFVTIQVVTSLPALYFFYIIMQGRTVKEFILLFNVSTILPTFIVFTINSSLVNILSSENNMTLNPDNYFDMYAVIFKYMGTKKGIKSQKPIYFSQ